MVKKGFKGIVYESDIFIKELKKIDKINIISIDYEGNKRKCIVNVFDFIHLIDDKLYVKKFSNFYDFNNELNGYKKMIKILKNKIKKYTTITEGFKYKNENIYGLFIDDIYIVFTEKCNKTIDKIKFTQKTFDKFFKQIMNILKIMEKNNYLHNDIKPSNIIECNGNFKLIDWEMSYNLRKQVNGFYISKSGNFLYNHPIKFYYNGIPLIVNKLIYGIELLYDKDIIKLKSPLIIRRIIEDSFDYLNKNKFIYFKYSDYFAFIMVYIFIAEKYNLKISLNLINPILHIFNIKMI